MTRLEKIEEMLNYIGLEADIVVFDESERIVDSTGHRLDQKIAPSYYWTDTVQSRAEKINGWLSCQTDGPNNDNFLWRLIFADMSTCYNLGNTLYLDNDTRAFLVMTNNWYEKYE